MAEPFLSEIRIMSFGYAPQGWAFCDGQLLPINQNQALFSLLGTIYGGDGRVNFGLPDLRERVPIKAGDSHTLGERGGEVTHTLTFAEMAMHTHVANASSAAASAVIPNNTTVLAQGQFEIYRAPSSLGAMRAVGNTGGSQAHSNVQPFLALSFCIALQGIFPSPT